MSKIICVAQTIEELKFLLSKTSKEVFVLPLDLDVQIYCKKEKINYLDPINYISKSFHEFGLRDSEKLIKSIRYQNLKFESIKVIVRAFLRFRFNSIIFLIYLINKICKKNNIKKIVVSGWDEYDGEYSKKNYYISHILSSFFKKKLTILTNKKFSKIENKKDTLFDMKIDNFKKKKYSNYVLLSSLGYNLFRFVKVFKKKKYTILTPQDKNLTLAKRSLFELLFNVQFFRFNYVPNKKRKIKIPKIKFSYPDKKIKYILDKRFNEEQGNLINLQSKFEAIDGLFDKINIDSVFSHNVRGEHGYYLECANMRNINSACIPHGTLAEFFNKYDKIYKNIIAEAIIFTKTKYIAVQSLIGKKFFDQNKNKFQKIKIDTGNLILSEAKRKKNKGKRKKILFAVTLKNFFNIQLLGVEMYYEFLDNLKFLNNLSKKNDLDIYVKPHPSAKDNLNDLSSLFPHLKFTNDKIDKVLSKVDLTISFSSTVIEDSLNSLVPVILFDRWKRYQHCRAEKNYNKKNASIYYINDKKNLLNCINTIYKSDKIFSKRNIFEGKSSNNLSSFLNKIEFK